MQVVPSGPDVSGDDLFAGILSFIFSARHRLWIVSPYFLPNEMLAEALQIAVRRGVDVRVVVPEKSDQVLVDLARGQFLRDLCALKCKVLLYTPGMVHAKALLVDEIAAAVGSANFDSRSMFLNFEVSSVIHSPADVRGVEAWIEKAHDANAGDGCDGRNSPRYDRRHRSSGRADALTVVELPWLLKCMPGGLSGKSISSSGSIFRAILPMACTARPIRSIDCE